MPCYVYCCAVVSYSCCFEYIYTFSVRQEKIKWERMKEYGWQEAKKKKKWWEKERKGSIVWEGPIFCSVQKHAI